ncbi:hypothetical protein [uncultured Paracoccus sp.]|uniref:hypothetical protein n=1 Tax=uncultured Paracoccus sp. TaxID=189685 RepID=UPI002637C2D5|nr:hypothetical protein [uncultured Paracoccus sp.]
MPAREPDHPITIHCPHCGGQNILADACASWNVETQEWKLSNVFDDTTCDDCGIDVSAVERPVQEGA